MKHHYKKSSIFVILTCLSSILMPTSALLNVATTSSAVALKDCSGIASGLFNNMRTPAALIGGAIVPLGLLSAPAIREGDCKKERLLKKANLLLAVASLLSEILAITYSTVAINKLAEINFPPTVGVSDLIATHFELAWIGTNVHFLLGMFGFGLLVGSKAYFTYGTKIGRIAGSWSIAAFLQCSSIVNRGISMGHGDASAAEFHYATNLFTLCCRYIYLMLKKTKRASLQIASLGFFVYSMFLTGQIVVKTIKEMCVEKHD